MLARPRWALGAGYPRPAPNIRSPRGPRGISRVATRPRGISASPAAATRPTEHPRRRPRPRRDPPPPRRPVSRGRPPRNHASTSQVRGHALQGQAQGARRGAARGARARARGLRSGGARARERQRQFARGPDPVVRRPPQVRLHRAAGRRARRVPPLAGRLGARAQQGVERPRRRHVRAPAPRWVFERTAPAFQGARISTPSSRGRVFKRTAPAFRRRRNDRRQSPSLRKPGTDVYFSPRKIHVAAPPRFVLVRLSPRNTHVAAAAPPRSVRGTPAQRKSTRAS